MVWVVGLIVYPSSKWVYVMIPGVIIFFNAWPTDAHEKR